MKRTRTAFPEIVVKPKEYKRPRRPNGCPKKRPVQKTSLKQRKKERKKLSVAMAKLPDNGPGRPPVYEPDSHPILAHKYCLLGCSNERLAEFFNITVITLEEWMRSHPEFSRAVLEARDYADANVAHSTYNRACGYDFVEKAYERVTVRDLKGNPIVDEATGRAKTELVLKRKNIKHIPADIAAAKFWLWNRTKNKPADQQWNDKQSVDIHTPDGPAAVIILPPKQES